MATWDRSNVRTYTLRTNGVSRTSNSFFSLSFKENSFCICEKPYSWVSGQTLEDFQNAKGFSSELKALGGD